MDSDILLALAILVVGAICALVFFICGFMIPFGVSLAAVVIALLRLWTILSEDYLE